MKRNETPPIGADDTVDATSEYEIAVVGAGPAGAAMATHLARSGKRVVLLDKDAFPRDKPCAECLSPVATPMLAELGVLDELLASRPARRPGFRIFAPNGRVIQGDFAATKDASGAPYFETGLAIPRRRLDSAIVGTATRAGADLREQWRLASLERDEAGHWRLTSVTGDAIRARLLVAADGVHSTVARRLGLQSPGGMRKIALVAHMRGIANLGDCVEMHIAGGRYVGIAPLEMREDGDLANVAMVVDEERDGRRLAGRAQAFLIESLATFPGLRDRIGNLTVERRALTVSRLHTRVRRFSGDGLLLVGDAAGYYDPFTGEGIARALRGAQLARDVALAAFAANDLGAAFLARYDRDLRRELRGKRTIERIIQLAVRYPLMMDQIARRLTRDKSMADTIIAVTGDILPASTVLRPSYMLRLLA